MQGREVPDDQRLIALADVRDLTILRDEDGRIARIYAIRNEPLPSQGELIGAVNELSAPDAIMVCAAGSLPGDLHKLWRTRHPKNYHMEYGYSCMGYEIAGGVGVGKSTAAAFVRALAVEAYYSDFVAPGKDGPGAWAEIDFNSPLATRLAKDWSYLGIA